MISRREFLGGSAALAITSRVPKLLAGHSPITVNDIHSQLNSTRVREILQPRSIEDVQHIVRAAKKKRRSISVSGGRHAMGGQQFGADTSLLDIRKLNRVRGLDRERGFMDVDAGIEWPELIAGYLSMQDGDSKTWGIAQKQTGADRLTMAGTMAANAHGRGLKMRPFISDVESFTLVDANGEPRNCSRNENAGLFSLVHGGYGLFGIVTSVKLRLVRRQKIERIVEIGTKDGLIDAFQKRIAQGFLYGDFQFSIEPGSADFLHKGVFSCYRPVPDSTPMPTSEKQLSDENWRELLSLAHTDPRKAFQEYSDYYLSTNGQLYWSDTHQLSIYPDNYHREIDARLHAPYPASEIITEIDVPRERLVDFLNEVREDFRKNDVDLIYGTVRIIERDEEKLFTLGEKSLCLHDLQPPYRAQPGWSGKIRRRLSQAD